MNLYEKMSFKLFRTRYYFSVTSKNLLKFSSPSTISLVVNKNVANFLKERCAGLGFVSNSRPSFDEKHEEIKLLGDYTMHIDNAIWRVLKEDTTFDDILLSKDEVLLIVYQILEGYNLENDKEIIKKTKSMINDNNLKKINDITTFLEELKKNIFENLEK